MIKSHYLTSSEVAKLLGFTEGHVRRLIIQGKLKAEKVGGSWLIKPKDAQKIKRQRFKRED
jgi:excisionase family DNA binding protein